MRIGYTCINHSTACSGNRTFRLASYSDERHLATVSNNLTCLSRILSWNIRHEILFFRITSDLVPFASHPVCTSGWQRYLADDLSAIGDLIARSRVRISMHPDQFIILNSPDRRVVERSIDELAYHAGLMDLLDLPATDKIQLHVGGMYGDPGGSIARFVHTYDRLDPLIRKRLVVENDDRRFAAADCLEIHNMSGIPVLFDVFHHACRNSGEDITTMLSLIARTWKGSDGTMMVDYSTQNPKKRMGAHAEHIDLDDFKHFLSVSKPMDMDIMLEIKDKESSALAAITAARRDSRFTGIQ